MTPPNLTSSAPPPAAAASPEAAAAARATTPAAQQARAGYYGHSVVKPPVWTWQVPLYFFLGGLAGMSAVLALGLIAAGRGAQGVTLAASWIAAVGGPVAAGLLVWDLGRPRRFLNMLRVFKPQSPMSVGAWLLAAFSGAALLLALVVTFLPEAAAAQLVCAALAAALGAPVATYTGVLIGATTVPVWARHHRLLPLQFAISALGSAAGLLELLGFRLPPLYWIGFACAAAEVAVSMVSEVRADPLVDGPLRRGRSGLVYRAGELASAVALGFRAVAWTTPGAAAFLLGSLLRRYGWLMAGRASAADPAAALATQRGPGGAA